MKTCFKTQLTELRLPGSSSVEMTLQSAVTGPQGLTGPPGADGRPGADGAALINDAITSPRNAWSSQKVSSMPGVSFDKASPGAIGTTTPGAVSASKLTVTGDVLQQDDPVALAQTWDNASVAFTGYKFDVNDAASAQTSLIADFRRNGASVFSVTKTGVRINASSFRVEDATTTVNVFGAYSATVAGLLRLGSSVLIIGSNLTGSSDVHIYRDATDTLALRRGTNTQTFRVYNTYTDASNYERAALTWAANIAYLRPEKAGTGASRLLIPVTGGATVASLPAAAAAGIGARSFVTDATSVIFLSVVIGGGSNKVPVVSDGINWLIG